MTEIFVKIRALKRLPENSRHFMKWQARTIVAEIRPKFSECTNCLGITWNAQATTSTFYNDYGRCSSSRIFASLWQPRLICACSVFRLRRERGIDVKCCQLRETRGGRGQKMLAPALSSQQIPLLSSPNVIPIPNALCHPGLVGVIHRVRGRPRVAPRNWVTAAGRLDEKQAGRLGFTLVRPLCVHPGNAYFSLLTAAQCGKTAR